MCSNSFMIEKNFFDSWQYSNRRELHLPNKETARKLPADITGGVGRLRLLPKGQERDKVSTVTTFTPHCPRGPSPSVCQQHDHLPETLHHLPTPPKLRPVLFLALGGGEGWGTVPGRLNWEERATDVVSAELFQGKFKLGLGFLQKPDLFSLANRKAAIEDTSLAGPRGCTKAACWPWVLGLREGGQLPAS